MSADLLRRAAAKIRETAEPVSGGRYPYRVDPTPVQIGEHVGIFEKQIQAVAFINMWTPDVAELVARVLDESAGWCEMYDDPGEAERVLHAEFALARRILGED